MTISRLFLYGAFLCPVACGGGSGGGGRVFSAPKDTAAPLEYNGVETRALLHSTNVGYFVFGLLADSQGATESGISGDGSGTVVSGLFQPLSHAAGLKMKPKEHTGGDAITVAAVVPVPGGQKTRSEPYEYSENCESGRIDYYVDIEDDGTGTVHVDNINCEMDGVLTDGLYIFEVSEYDLQNSSITSGTIKFNRLSIRENGLDTVNSGSLEIRTFPENNHERLTMNVVFEESNSGRRIRLDDMVFDTYYENFIDSSTYTESISGRLYDSEYGYVDVTTILPISYNFDFLDIPVGGHLMLAGAGGSKAYIKFPGGPNVLVYVDADGDGLPENSAIMNVQRLASGEYTDIGDDDGDGLPNSWEVFYGLGPQNPADSDLDLDGDSQNNRGEYQAGMAPNNARSTAPASDIRLSLNPFVEDRRYPAGHEASLNLVVGNAGPDEANFINARIAMPPEFDLLSASTAEMEEACDISSNVVSCEFMKEHNAGFIQINFVLPEEIGSFSYEASVISYSSYDPDESNNVLGGVIEVEPATAELSVNLLDSSDPVPTVHDFVYLVEIENAGAVTAANVRAEIELPQEVTLLNAFPQTGCELTGGILACAMGDIGSGITRDVTVLVRPSSSTGPITASVTVTTDTAELNMTDNRATQSTEIITPISDLHMNFTSTRPYAFVGNQWSWWIFPTSSGPHTLPEVQITIDLPPEIELVSIEIPFSTGQCMGQDPIFCTVPKHIGSATYPTVRLQLRSSIAGIHEFPVTITGATDDPVLSNNTVINSAFIGNSVGPIMAQLEAANDGDTIEVPAGHYLGDLRFPDGKNISLVAVDGPENTFMASMATGIGINNAVSGGISGFTFTHGTSSAISLFNSDVIIRGNVFENNSGSFASAVFITGDSSPIIERNIMRNTFCDVSWRGVVTIANESDSVIRNNVFLDNKCAGVYISNIANSPAVITNNDFIGNDTGVVIPAAARNAGIYVGNNIFYGNGAGIETVTDCGLDCSAFQSNLLYNNGDDYQDSPNQAGINANVSADPLFTDAANGDYTLQPGSPAIDAADALSAPSDDFNGNPRPVDGDGSGTAEPDIGAYEFQ